MNSKKKEDISDSDDDESFFRKCSGENVGKGVQYLHLDQSVTYFHYCKNQIQSCIRVALAVLLVLSMQLLCAYEYESTSNWNDQIVIFSWIW